MTDSPAPPPSAARRAQLLVPALALVVLLAGAAALTGEAQDRSEPDPGSRTGECAICARMVEISGTGEFAEDPHAFACAECHHPHTRRTEQDWFRTCQNDACHPRAWTRSVFHRVEPTVFLDCRNCHVPHRFTADGSDCASCHGGVHEAPGTVAAPAVSGVAEFPHARHEGLECSVCHAARTDHATLTVTDREQCMDCHHGEQQEAPCASCHGASAAERGAWTMQLEFSVWDGPRERTLPFDHEFHSGMLDCDTCHPADSGFAAQVNCLDCHELHHNEDADCMGCHRTPPDDVHDYETVHETLECGICHEGAFETMPLQRNFCLACHQDLVDHNAGENCVSCHEL